MAGVHGWYSGRGRGMSSLLLVFFKMNNMPTKLSADIVGIYIDLQVGSSHEAAWIQDRHFTLA